jgi:hypothetical protein
MNTISSIVWCVLFMFFAASTSALGAQKTEATGSSTETKSLGAQKTEATGSSTETKATTEGLKLSLRIPVSSPLFSQFPIATVNDEVITIDQLIKALASSHESRQEDGVQAGKISFTSMLDRLINIVLITQEAVNIGLDELPEFKSDVEENASQTLASMVMNDITKDVKADPVAVEKRYKEMVVEWKIKSVMFDKEDDAKAMSDAIKAGKSFDELAKSARDEKKATGNEQAEFLKPKDLHPSVAAMARSLEVGGVSPVIKLLVGTKTGFAILHLEDKRYPEDPAARQRAERIVRIDKKNEALTEYKNMLYKTQVTIKEKLLNKIDYDSPKADFKKLLSDDRVLVEFKDGKTITVGALTEALQNRYFHGLEQASKDKVLNKSKRDVLNKIIEDQLIRNDGLRRGVENSEEYKDRIREFRLSSLFGLFVQRVVIPDVKVTDDEMRSYYQKHQGEYMDPEMIKMTSLNFRNKRDAEAALKKLKRGDDLNWVRANAEGLVAPSNDEGGSSMGMQIVTTKSLPAEMAKAVAGAKAGDFRLSPGSGDEFSVLSIQEIIPARQMPYEEVKGEIWKPVYSNNVAGAIEEWIHKLRAAADIRVFLSEKGN